MRLNGLREYKFYIDDIRQAICRIQLYIKNYSKAEFLNDPKTYDSVLHNLMVIGEAAGKIPEEVREKNPDINWSGMIGMRNVITHGYFIVDSDIIWVTITERLSELAVKLGEIK